MKLDAADRKAIPKKKFGWPAKSKYPMPDKAHARNALARVAQQEPKGNVPPDIAAHIRAMAHAMLARG
jgi:hypothetical protein